jgi:hypothetical protein
MRVGENLAPFWQNLAFVLLVLAYSLCFVTAISALWGWRGIGLAQCAVLVVLVIDERNAIRRALIDDAARKADRVFAWYKLALVFAAVFVNVVLGGLWLAGIYR